MKKIVIAAVVVCVGIVGVSGVVGLAIEDANNVEVSSTSTVRETTTTIAPTTTEVTVDEEFLIDLTVTVVAEDFCPSYLSGKAIGLPDSVMLDAFSEGYNDPTLPPAEDMFEALTEAC